MGGWIICWLNPFAHQASLNMVEVHIDLGNGLLPDGTKPLPTSMMIVHQWGTGIVTWGLFWRIDINHYNVHKHYPLKIKATPSRDQYVRDFFVVYILTVPKFTVGYPHQNLYELTWIFKPGFWLAGSMLPANQKPGLKILVKPRLPPKQRHWNCIL